MKNIFQDLKRKDHKRYLGGLDVFKYIGPGLLVTVGFIDPGNWASNFAAGSEFGRKPRIRNIIFELIIYKYLLILSERTSQSF